MAKILSIMASPRKNGNSELLSNEFKRGAEKAGHQIDEVVLRTIKINPCLEIYACKKTGRCVIKDDFDEVYAKLETCDKLAIFTPIFFSALPAQLKALIDRCQTFYMRKYVLDDPVLPADEPKRDAYLIAVGGSKDKDLVIASELTLKYFLSSLDMQLTKTLAYRKIDNKGDILQHETAMQDVFELGLNI